MLSYVGNIHLSCKDSILHLQVSGVQVALGYHRRPELTRASFTEEKGQRDARQMVERLCIYIYRYGIKHTLDVNRNITRRGYFFREITKFFAGPAGGWI